MQIGMKQTFHWCFHRSFPLSHRRRTGPCRARRDLGRQAQSCGHLRLVMLQGSNGAQELEGGRVSFTGEQ